MKKYDAIIIGGGCSGSITAAYLARAGKKVAIFEREDQIGGTYWRAYEKEGGYKSEYFSHLPMWHIGLENRGNWNMACKELNIPLKFVVMPNSAVWYYKNGGQPVNIPTCTCGEAYVQFLEESSGHKLPESTRKALIKIYDTYNNMTDEEMWGPYAQTHSIGEWLEDVTDDEGAIEFMKRINGTIGGGDNDVTDLYSMNLTQFAIAFEFYLGRGQLIATQGDTACVIPQEFGRAAEKDGADIYYNTEVDKILIEDNKVVGVRTKDGEYYADNVVVASHWMSHRKMLDACYFPDYMEETFKDYERTVTIPIDIHYGLKSDVVKYPAWSCVMLQDEKGNYDFMIAVPSFYNTAFAPRGKQLVHIECYRSLKVFKTKTLEEWVEHIEETCEELFPGWKENVEWREVYVAATTETHAYSAHRKMPNIHPTVKGLFFVGGSSEGPFTSLDICTTTAVRVKDVIIGNPPSENTLKLFNKKR